MSNSLRPHGLQPTRLLCPLDFPGKSAGVGCHCLLLPCLLLGLKHSLYCVLGRSKWVQYFWQTRKGTEALKTDCHESFDSVICYLVKNNNLFWTSVSSSFKINSPILTFWLFNTASCFPIPSRLGVSLATSQSCTQLVKICLQWGGPSFNPWFGKIPWRRERLPTPVFWPGEFHGLYSPQGHKESDTTEWITDTHTFLV